MLLFFLFPVLIQCTSVEKKEKDGGAPVVKNIIVMIGDGMGVSQVYAGLTANKGSLNLERCRYVGFSKTYSANDYITDSAASGTAIACGVKTNNGTIGMDSLNQPVNSMLAHAVNNGLSTGIVVTYAVTDATPAAFIAHQPRRSMQDEIAMDYLASGVTVCIGGGRKHFEKRADSLNLSEQLKDKGYQIAYSSDEVKQVTSGKLFGLLTDTFLPYAERGNMLPESVETALRILQTNEKGFFLMVEGSQIDRGGHRYDTQLIVNEMLDFDRAVKVALDFAEKTPNTLVVVTADHETGGFAVHGGNFATGEVEGAFTTNRHTGVMVPVFAFGDGAEAFAGIYQNVDIFSKVLALYGFDK
jgi:alkaline phosphatase